jgi:uncharacterized membrane protein YfcA
MLAALADRTQLPPFNGGLIGSHLARRIPRNVIRVLIVGVVAALTVAFARQYWF